MAAPGQRSPWVAVTLSILVHALIVVALTFSIPLRSPERALPNVVPIDTIVVDEGAIERQMARLEEEARLEAERIEADRLRVEREAEEARRQAEAEAERREQQRLAEQRAEQERIQREAEAAAEAERIRLQQIEEQRLAEQRAAEEAARREAEEAARREAEEQARREAEEQARREAEAAARRAAEEERRRREQEARERELAAALAAEDEARRARQSGLLDQYIRSIQNRIEQRWIRPPSAGSDLECVVNVTQIPSGEVTGVSVGRCNGDAAVVRSIENAVLSASPLPQPPPPSLFSRTLVLTFKPDDSL